VLSVARAPNLPFVESAYEDASGSAYGVRFSNGCNLTPGLRNLLNLQRPCHAIRQTLDGVLARAKEPYSAMLEDAKHVIHVIHPAISRLDELWIHGNHAWWKPHNKVLS
jgi:hypothetical protein